jgi:hypothetical protein
MPSFSVLAESEGSCFWSGILQLELPTLLVCDGLPPGNSSFRLRAGLSIADPFRHRADTIERSVMRKYDFLILACALFGGSANGAVILREEFAANPATRDWRAFGDVSLFNWNDTNKNLEVTWDSSRPNSYFTWPLNTVLSRSDDFSLAFDLRLSDIAAGTNPGKPFTFQLAIGFINLAEAAATNFVRGTGTDSPDLIEFDYFPASDFDATVSPTIISGNVQFASSFNFPLELTIHDWFHVMMSYTASNQTLVTAMTRNGAAFGTIQDVNLGTNFTDFRADHFAINSYSDAGQDPQFAGSILAHGVVDNVVITIPDPVVPDLAGTFADGVWQIEFTARTHWLYTLERTEDFRSWSSASHVTPGVDRPMTLMDTNTTAPKAYYRVRAERP